jgi:hypothetical protein
MTQIMLRKLISPRHKCSIRHAGGLVQTVLSATTPPGFLTPPRCAEKLDAREPEAAQVADTRWTDDHTDAVGRAHKLQ